MQQLGEDIGEHVGTGRRQEPEATLQGPVLLAVEGAEDGIGGIELITLAAVFAFNLPAKPLLENRMPKLVDVIEQKSAARRLEVDYLAGHDCTFRNTLFCGIAAPWPDGGNWESSQGVLNTYLVYLRHKLHTAEVTKEAYNQAVSEVIALIDAQKEARPHLGEFMEAWGASSGNRFLMD
jgi:hypothetical protein